MTALGSILKNSIPFRRQLRALKRAIVPYRSNPANDSDLLEWSLRMAAALADAGAQIPGSTVVEIGTGWVPILPLVFRMAGASEIITVDQDRLMDRNTFLHAISSIHKNMDRLLRQTGIPKELFDLRRLPSRQEETLGTLCNQSGVTYKAPSDFMDLAPGSADFIVSRTVLEHIPEPALRNIFAHAAKVLRPGGMMCHEIDMSDHFEHRDKSISTVDMLGLDDAAWAPKIHDPQDYQNRLRRFEFGEILRDGGWEIVQMDGEPYPPALDALKTMKLIPRYANVPHEELAILWSVVVAKRPA